MTNAVSELRVFAIDADVLIFAGDPTTRHGMRCRDLFGKPDLYLLRGSTLLLPEVLTKPRRTKDEAVLAALRELITHLQLCEPTLRVCESAVSLGAIYGLKSIDAVHLATAIDAEADAFLTNNSKDFDPERITEIDVIFPDDLP